MSQYSHNFRAQDSHLDPPDEPEIKDDDEYLSTCCGANSESDTHDGDGICTWCKEHATFENEKGETE